MNFLVWRGARILGLAALAVSAIAATGCRRASENHAAEIGPTGQATDTPARSPWFIDVAAEAGLDFEHRSGHDGRSYLLPESAAGGAALFDMDGDGDLDVYLVQGAEPGSGSGQPGNRLFRNALEEASGTGNGWRFEDVTATSGAGDPGYGMGVAAADYDRDGDLDLYVTNVGPNVLLRNDLGADGAISFTDVTAESGVGDPGLGASATFVDYDLDGDLDLFVVNYVVWSEPAERDCRNRLGESDYCDPTEYDAPAPDILFRNDGPDENGIVRFRDVSRETGIDRAYGNGLGVVSADFNGDGWPDIFVSNDRMPDHLWINQADSAREPGFREEGATAGCALDDDATPKAGMGVDAVDIDYDGDADLLVGNFSAESDSFYRNDGSFFVDATAGFGLKAVSRPFTRFGLGLHDFDNDGLLDLFQGTGRVSRQERRYGGDPYAEPNLLFRGTRGKSGGIRFEEVQPRGGTASSLAAAARAAAFGDLDNDGGVDVLVVNRDGPIHLLRNSNADRGNWISFLVLDEYGAPALGASLELDLGGRRISRQVKSAYSYLAASDPRVHVGLGRATAVTSVSVRWFDGTVERFGDFDVGRIWTLRRGQAGRPPPDG